MTHRERFVAAAVAKLGCPVCWACKGPRAFDCSGLCTFCLREVGGPDLTALDNAQRLHDGTRMLVSGELPLEGDLVFYGLNPKAIEHVAIYMADGGVISADGATSRITDIAAAIANPVCRVRKHTTIHYRSDLPLIVIHRNTFVDLLDGVSL